MAKPVTPRPSAADYVYENLGIVEVDTDQMDADCCTQFKAGSSMEQGVSGRKKIDTTYENYSEDMVDAPRSDGPDNKASPTKPAPMPMDLARYPHRRT